VHDQNISSALLQFLKLSQIVARLQAEWYAMKAAVSHLESFVSVPLGDMNILETLKKPERAGLGEALGGIVIAADYDYRNARIRQPHEPTLKDKQRLDLGPNMMEYVPCMYNSIRFQLNDLINGPIKSGIYLFFYEV